jgi:glucokinase
MSTAAGGGAQAFGLDVGGTNIRIGLVEADGTILQRERVATPDAADQRVKAMVDLVARARDRAGRTDLPVGVGAAGLVDLDGVVRYAPNLDWRDAPLRAQLEQQLGTTVLVENDASAAMWGEYSAGAARAVEGGAIMLTLGTGVGGGLVMDGQLQRGSTGVGGEFGHMIVNEGGPRCPCGNRGCLEALASGSAIGRTAREAVAARRHHGSVLADVEDLTGTHVTEAARAGDQLAIEVLDEVGGWLGVGIASLVNCLDPAVVIIGGGALSAGPLLLTPAVESYRARVVAREHRTVPRVVRAELGDDAGLIGAALLAAAAAA